MYNGATDPRAEPQSPYYNYQPNNNNYMWGAIAGAGIQGLMGLYGQYRAQRHDESLAADQRAWNWKMANQQNQWNLDFWNKQKQFNLDMWNRNNQYNSPLEQMQRLEAAGLNPHLIYGKGTTGNSAGPPAATLGNAADVKGYNRAQSRNVAEGLKVFSDMYQFKQLNAQTNNVLAQTDVAKQQKLNMVQDGLLKATKADIMAKAKGAIIRKYLSDADISETKADKDKINLEILKDTTEEQKQYIKDRTAALQKKLEIMGQQYDMNEFRKDVESLKSEFAKKGILNPQDVLIQVLTQIGLFDAILDGLKYSGELF